MDLSSIFNMDSIMNVATEIADKMLSSTLGFVDQIVSTMK